MMEAVRTSETSVDNHFTRLYNPEDNSEHHTRRRENLKSHITYFGGEVKRQLYVVRLYGKLKIPLGMIDTDSQNLLAISCPFSPRFTTRFVCYNQSKELWLMKVE
jgi:hypothetical protein